MGETFDAMDLFDLADEIRDRVKEGASVSHTTFVSISEEYDVEVADVYAAFSMCSELTFQREFPAQVQVCIGRCQFSGGAKLLRSLVAKRLAGQAQTDIVAVSCIDKCDDAPVLRSDGPSGQYVHPRVTEGLLPEILLTLAE